MFRIVGQPATMRMSDMDLAWTIGLGLALAMVLQSVLRLKSAGHTVMLLVGVVAMASPFNTTIADSVGPGGGRSGAPTESSTSRHAAEA